MGEFGIDVNTPGLVALPGYTKWAAALYHASKLRISFFLFTGAICHVDVAPLLDIKNVMTIEEAKSSAQEDFENVQAMLKECSMFSTNPPSTKEEAILEVKNFTFVHLGEASEQPKTRRKICCVNLNNQ
ncbi:Uncharacterized protein Fot_01460 [Forsythia ovata]|uniref:Uncharacterized protein n=1 Tax=Forsythia ovata TaxID=205694 RepID=A0ABD1X413_9LAMI